MDCIETNDQLSQDSLFFNADLQHTAGNLTRMSEDPSTSCSSPDRMTPNTSTAEDNCSNDVKEEFNEFCQFAFPEHDRSSDVKRGTSFDPFYFESDHVALKGNEDYHRLLRAFILLESQRKSALRDLDTLLELQRQALNDPIQFATQLTRGDIKKRFPARTAIAELPAIAWERYTDDVEAVLASIGGTAQSTRQKQKRDLMNGIRNPTTPVTASSSSSSVDEKAVTAGQQQPHQRPATFNQAWSVDEQRHLEKLLQKYPPERFEARRFAKIAAELPGRTTQQVTSRVQKYFIKLAKAGLPVPGRVPNLAAHGGRWLGGRFHGRQRHSQFYYPPSTFLTSYAPPVYMSDDDGDDLDFETTSNTRAGTGDVKQASSSVDWSSDDDDDDASGIPMPLHDTPEYRELKTLSALRRSRSRQPVSATTSIHDRSHIDLDYTSESTGISSYLDPNYMPAL